ncbi:MAG: MarR family transcriptional regulator [Rhodospirillales bacterium RIFCSPLOWO2_12_FULL_58_28]|nr:MAG: MarR family transcriptional regulator [Rhodospirillales bacterium RIFCSPLOWO2_02_FULL_58_16]OHC78296.1 MAG: MarR family transcriptional regulator [Rhodospirillales bacterium RIFCSPLOWO2_12_FULL_58_28]
MKKEYLELTRLIERLHRRFLDVLRVELNRMSIKDINAVQALLLANIKDEQIAIRDLVERGYYQGSNVSYNIKKLTDMGYLTQERSAHDKRSVSIRLTEKALGVVKKVRELDDVSSEAMVKSGISAAEIDASCASLRRLERIWADYIHYGGD